MSCEKLVASALMSALPFYVPKNYSLADAIDKIEQYKLSQVIVTDSNFVTVGTITKKQIAKFLLLKQLKRYDYKTHEIKIGELFDASKPCIVAYPATEISEIKEVMEALRLNHIPIVKSPWNKVLIGFISLENIQVVLGNLPLLSLIG